MERFLEGTSDGIRSVVVSVLKIPSIVNAGKNQSDLAWVSDHQYSWEQDKMTNLLRERWVISDNCRWDKLMTDENSSLLRETFSMRGWRKPSWFWRLKLISVSSGWRRLRSVSEPEFEEMICVGKSIMAALELWSGSHTDDTVEVERTRERNDYR